MLIGGKKAIVLPIVNGGQQHVAPVQQAWIRWKVSKGFDDELKTELDADFAVHLQKSGAPQFSDLVLHERADNSKVAGGDWKVCVVRKLRMPRSSFVSHPPITVSPVTEIAT